MQHALRNIALIKCQPKKQRYVTPEAMTYKTRF